MKAAQAGREALMFRGPIQSKFDFHRVLALFDLDGKTKRAIALDELVMAVNLETIEHEEDCRCGHCMALEAVEG